MLSENYAGKELLLKSVCNTHESGDFFTQYLMICIKL